MDIYNIVQLVKMVESLQDGGVVTDFVYKDAHTVLVDVDGVTFEFNMIH